MKCAIFPGSFNPFTVGHKWIVEQSLGIFDKVIILFAENSSKSENGNFYNNSYNVQCVRKAYENDERVVVLTTHNLTMDVAKEHNAVIVRGIRDVKDFEYEKNIAEINSRIGGVQTMFFITPPELAWVSSSAVRELQKHGKDMSEFTVR